MLGPERAADLLQTLWKIDEALDVSAVLAEVRV
jgi:hypothetical protein